MSNLRKNRVPDDLMLWRACKPLLSCARYIYRAGLCLAALVTSMRGHQSCLRKK